MAISTLGVEKDAPRLKFHQNRLALTLNTVEEDYDKALASRLQEAKVEVPVNPHQNMVAVLPNKDQKHHLNQVANMVVVEDDSLVNHLENLHQSLVAALVDRHHQNQAINMAVEDDSLVDLVEHLVEGQQLLMPLLQHAAVKLKQQLHLVMCMVGEGTARLKHQQQLHHQVMYTEETAVYTEDKEGSVTKAPSDPAAYWRDPCKRLV